MNNECMTIKSTVSGEKQHKYGVFIARMQPLHNAHLWVIKRMLQECEYVIIILGSENKRDMLRNPFDIELRMEILKEAINNDEEMAQITVYTLPDWSTEADYENSKEWGRFLYYNIVSRIESKTFTMYFSDDPNIMLNWFEDYIKERITFRFFERVDVFDGLSATKIRKAFETGDIDYISKFCPVPVVKRIDLLISIWFQVKESPKEDFAMI